MALDLTGVNKTLGDITTTLKQFKNQDVGNMNPDMQGLQAGLVKSLTSALPSEPLATTQNTILDKYNQRRALAERGAESQAELIRSQASESIEEQERINKNQLAGELESRRGFATNTALIRDVENTGMKRVRDLEKTRDQLLLQNDAEKASRLDNLIVQEQESISKARTDYLNSLFGITSAMTSVAGFETPEQKRQRDLQSETQKSVINLAAKAPDVGILPTDDISTALSKYKDSSVYKNDIRKGELEISKLQGEISKNAADTAKIRAEAQGLDTSTLDPTSLALTRSLQFLTPGATADQRKDMVKTFTSMMKLGEVDNAKEFVKRIAREVAPTEEQSKATGREEAIVALNTVQSALNSFIEKGGNTGILTGSIENIENKLGRTKDPDLVKIGNSIRLAIIDYRKAVSGAAFTPSEMEEYMSLFPSIGNVPELNNARIEALLNTFNRNQGLFYSRMLGPSSYQTLFGEASPVGSYSLSGGGSAGQESIMGDNLFSSLFNQ